MVARVSVNVVQNKLPAAHVENKPAALRAVVVKRNILIVLLVRVDRLRLKKGLPLLEIKQVFSDNARSAREKALTHPVLRTVPRPSS